MKNLKPLLGHEGRYGFCMKTNRVWSYPKGGVNLKGKFLKPWKDRCGYLRVDLWRKCRSEGRFIHRIVYEAHHGAIPEGLQIDHIDRDILNNSIENLRLATHLQNLQNQGAQKNNKLGVKGVSLKNGKYVSRINHNGKACYLGIFNTVEEAVNAYNEKSVDLRGQFHSPSEVNGENFLIK